LAQQRVTKTIEEICTIYDLPPVSSFSFLLPRDTLRNTIQLHFVLQIAFNMTNISVRLPPEIEHDLDEEARLTDRNRSDLVREAVGKYLMQRQRERMIKAYSDEMRRAYADPEYVEEMRRIQHDFDATDDWLARIEAEERAAGIDPNEKWWD